MFLRRGRSQKKGEADPLPLSSKASSGKIRNRQEFRKWLILIGLSILTSLLLFPNILVKPHQYVLGEVADRDIKATRDFLVQNEVLTGEKREEAVKAVLSVYDFDPTGDRLVTRLRQAFAEGRKYLSQPAPMVGEDSTSEPAAPTETFRDRFFEILEIEPDTDLFQSLSESLFPPEIENSVIKLVTQILKRGVVSNRAMLLDEAGKGVLLRHVHLEKEVKVTDLNRFYDLKQARAFLQGQTSTLRRHMTPESLVGVSVKLASALIKPNLTFNKRQTELRKSNAEKSVKPFYFKVKRGEMLLREGERVTPEQLLKLAEEYSSSGWKERLAQAPAMAVLIVILLAATYWMGLMGGGPSQGEVKDIFFCALTVLILFLITMASRVVAEEIARGFGFMRPRILFFIIPVATGAMLISIFQGFRIAVTFSVILAFLAAVVVRGGIDFFMYFLIGNLIAAYGVRNCRDRGTLIRAGLNVGAVNIILALSVETLHGSSYGVEAGVACVSAFLGGILVGIMTTGILPLVEMSFGFTTDIKLLELASLDQPLLKELMVRAPGTYHHSVIVSNLVEAAAEAIDANPLLAKVAAYYHDIGKMRKPLYFIENQGHRENKHEKLAPSMSGLILISHVKDGVELAREQRLGREIIDIIHQHHGKSLIQYFYQKAKEQAERKETKVSQVKKEDFRYPGPKPQTKEAGLVMLADMVEAATKTLAEPTVARVQGMVQKIVNGVFSDGQLSECELTLKDLNEIAKNFNKALSGIYHHRVEYPEAATKNAASKTQTNGNTDHVSNENGRDSSTGVQEKPEEGLKRLGLS